nr:methyl-accepting chemotaxis protein [Bacillus ectoiniformans]
MGEQNLKNDVQFVLSTIELLNKQVESGELPLKEAQEQVKVMMLGERKSDGTRPITDKFDLGASGYMFVLDDNGILLAHPKLEDEDLTEAVDPDGVNVGQGLVDVANANKNGGFHYYQWALPETGEVEPKVTFIAKDPHWGWNVGAGTYMQDFNSGADRILTSLLITLVGAFIIGGLIIYLYTKRLIVPLLQVDKAVQYISKGDLSKRSLSIKRSDELGRLADNINVMQDEIRHIIHDVDKNAEKVSAAANELNAASDGATNASEQISDSMSGIASSAEVQKRFINETTSTVKQMNDSIIVIRSQSKEAVAATTEATDAAKTGMNILTSSASQMHDITDSIGSLAEVISTLVKQTNNIDSIVKVISDIANQTNLLALNASIEAARAGENGKGFAVVAEEVRKLAEQSSSSTGKIADLIQNIQQQVKKAEATMTQSTAEVQEGVQTIDQANNNFNAIQTAIDHVKEVIINISDKIESIGSDTEQIVYSVESLESGAHEAAAGTENIAAATEEQLASIEEISASTESLSTLADELHQSVQRFKLN